jgi:pimeloyl-ACP methyl ester carboxylesterase
MEQEGKFTSAGVQISGTLRLPDSADATGVVLLLPGSGQTDRNENVKQLHINAMADIAAFLEERQIASFRYDKRGVGASGGDYWESGFYDRVTDAAAALTYLKSDARLGGLPLFALGHSEGALVSTRLAAEGLGLAGAILVAGAAETGEEILHWQVVQVTKGLSGFNKFIINLFHIDVLKSQDKALQKIKQSTKSWYRQGMQKVNGKWMREFLAYDPAADLARIQIPVLALTGSKDIQVNPADLQRMAETVKG